jgi:signal transduction histidine kinase
MDNAIAAPRREPSPCFALRDALPSLAGCVPRSGLLLAAALFTLASGLIYALGAAEADRPVDALSGWLLTAVGLLQLCAACAMVVRPARRLLVVAAGADGVYATVWGVSRSIGLPFGPVSWSPWQLGTTDLICTAFELLAALVLVWLVLRPAARPIRWGAVRAALGATVAFLVASYLGFAAKVTADVDLPAPPLSDVRIIPGQMATFTYCSPDQYGLVMDFYAPRAAAQQPVPVVLQIHGGVGIYGDRKAELIPPVAMLNDAGFAVAAIDYRRAPMVVSYVLRTARELRMTRAEMARLAVANERLRFARDLHDLLGHSLSLVALKADLVEQLIPHAPERAVQEVRDVQRVSRAALKEVREAVAGYRQPSLATELTGAQEMLAAAGIGCHVDGEAAVLPPVVDATLAWVLREAVTNVIRHSHARRCAIHLTARDGAAGLEVVDDGRGAPADVDHQPGNGLAGLVERVAAVGGWCQAGPRPGGGFQVVACLPLQTAAQV